MTIYMRNDQPPSNDVSVRVPSPMLSIDKGSSMPWAPQGGADFHAIPRGLVEWSLLIDQLGPGGGGPKSYRTTRRRLGRCGREAGFPKGLKAPLNTTGAMAAGTSSTP